MSRRALLSLTAHPYCDNQFGKSLVSVPILPSGVSLKVT